MFAELRHFLLVADRASFTGAARAAHLTQPALSASIRRLEEDLGTRLFDRGRRGAFLTATGRALLPRARAALSAVDDARRAVREVEDLTRGEVRIGAGSTTATYLLPPVLARFRRRYPGVRIILRELSRDAAAEAIDAGTLDLAITTGPGGEQGPRATRSLTVNEPWRDDAFVLVGAPGAKLAGARFITFPEGSATRVALDRHFPDAEIVMELFSIAAIKGHVAEGIGVALISRTAVERDLAAGRLVKLRHPATPIARELVLLHRGQDRLPPAAAAVRELLLASRAGRR
jgi:DNA-binding transcriptional LysR family regulator